MSQNKDSSLVITGFMATGKTSVGQVVAEKLGREFVDIDALIESREGMSVRALFETHGEVFFRAREVQVCAELAARKNLVIATGGGTLIDARNRVAFRNAFVVCLDATPATILARLAPRDASDRPMLASDDLPQRIDELLRARREAYAVIACHVATTGKTVNQVAGEIIELFQITRMNVTSPEGEYPILVGTGLLARTGALLAELNSPAKFSARCAIVTNPRVRELHAAPLVGSLCRAGFEPRIIEMPEGERFKTLDTVRSIYDKLIDAELDRRSIIFALGGGVIGDVAGFAAATLLRGVPFVQLPTTLLAMVDASIGGKVAVDHPRGKNLIGAFKQPRAVIADTAVMATLPPEEFRAGMAEVVKHAIIADAELFEELEAGSWKSKVEDWIARAMRVKVKIVVRDPFERGERAKLNLGHTFGHAFEKLSDYRLRHGDAVAIGLVCAARLAAQRGLAEARLAPRIENLLRTIGLPTRVPRQMSVEAMLDAMTTDKKRVDARLWFILPRALSDVVIVGDVTPGEIAAVIEETWE